MHSSRPFFRLLHSRGCTLLHSCNNATLLGRDACIIHHISEEGVSVEISDLSGHPKRFSQMGVVVIPRKSFFGGGRRVAD